MWLFVAFVLLPLIEIGLFVRVGGWIGLWPTLALVLAMAALGSWILRVQGGMARADLRRSLDEFRDPAEPVAHGGLILLAGLLLLIPGFFTDLIGLALLIRPARNLAVRALAGRFRLVTTRNRQGARSRHTSQDHVIEGEYRELGDVRRRDGPSGWTRH
jgi:UPF0716 protein FxsA